MTPAESMLYPLGHERTYPPKNATAYPMSSITEIESRFFFNLDTYNTSLILRGFLDSS
jgi:hypothetical protein